MRRDEAAADNDVEIVATVDGEICDRVGQGKRCLVESVDEALDPLWQRQNVVEVWANSWTVKLSGADFLPFQPGRWLEGAGLNAHCVMLQVCDTLLRRPAAHLCQSITSFIGAHVPSCLSCHAGSMYPRCAITRPDPRHHLREVPARQHAADGGARPRVHLQAAAGRCAHRRRRSRIPSRACGREPLGAPRDTTHL